MYVCIGIGVALFGIGAFIFVMSGRILVYQTFNSSYYRQGVFQLDVDDIVRLKTKKYGKPTREKGHQKTNH